MLREFVCNRWNLLLLAGTLAPLALQADVIFSNVSGNSPTNSVSVDPQVEAAEAFTPTGNFSMTDAEVLISVLSPGGSANLFLYSNSSGEPGTEIEQLASDLTPSSPTLVTASSFAPIDLTGGTEYWLVLTASGDGALVDWYNAGSVSVPEAYRVTLGDTWATRTDNLQFQIDGTPITTTPEPSALPLASVAVLGLLIAAHRTARRSTGRWGTGSTEPLSR